MTDFSAYLSTHPQDSAVAFYNVVHTHVCRASHVSCIDVAPPVCLHTVPLELSVVRNISILYNNTTLTENEWSIILQKRWFSGDIIDCYMSLLTHHSPHKIYSHSCFWLGNYLFNNNDIQKPTWNILQREQERVHWFTASGNANWNYVIMPMSIHNSHFILVIFDFLQKVIYCCDSMGGIHNTVRDQCLRYLEFEYFWCTSVAYDHNDWRVCNYCTADSGFPKQTDTHNCGAYVCVMAKCIIQNRQLRFTTVDSLRWTVCYELTNNTLL